MSYSVHNSACPGVYPLISPREHRVRVHILHKWLRIAGIVALGASIIEHQNCHYSRQWLFSTGVAGYVGCIAVPDCLTVFEFSSLEDFNKQSLSSSDRSPGAGAFLHHLQIVQARPEGVV